MKRPSMGTTQEDLPVQRMLLSFYRDIAERRSYWIPVCMLAVLSYGFSMANRTVSIDDLARLDYIGDGARMFAGMRWGMVLWVRLFSTFQYSPFVDQFMGVLFLLLSASLICAILYSQNGQDKRIWPYTVFSSVFLTYPFVNEIWGYNGANMAVYGNMVLVSLALLIQLSRKTSDVRSVSIAALLLTPVVSSYESAAFVYVSLVFAIFYLRYGILSQGRQRAETWSREGARYSLPLAISIVLRVVVGSLILKIMGLQFALNGDTGIFYLEAGLWEGIRRMILGNGFRYVFIGLVYFPVQVFLSCAVVFVVFSVLLSVQRKDRQIILLGACLLLSLFLLSFLQGQPLPVRAGQTIQFFVAFVCYLLAGLPFERARPQVRSRLTTALTLGLMFLSFRQAVYLHEMLALNNQRSDVEAAIVQMIGYRIYSEFDRSRPVIVCGGVDLGDQIRSQVTAKDESLYKRILPHLLSVARDRDADAYDKYIGTNVNPVIDWSLTAFHGDPNMLERLFSYYGFDLDFVPVSQEDLDLYVETAKAHEMRPYEIRDFGGYLLVYLGPGS